MRKRAEKMKTYVGERDATYGWQVNIYDDQTKRIYALDPKPSQRINNHSPDGFSWGYGGSGPAQLALAILLDVYRDETIATENYQDFKWNVIARLNQDSGFELTEQQVREALDDIAKEKQA